MASRIRIGLWPNRLAPRKDRGERLRHSSIRPAARHCYIQLTPAEWAFRITKDELELRPIWHHKADRVKAHILVCFLAYAMWKTLAGWMKNAGLGDAPRTLLEEVAKLKSGDVALQARSPRDGHPRRITLRCVTEPDEAQAVLLHRLGLTLPRRLRRMDDMIQM